MTETPRTGHPTVDEALAGVGDLSELSAAERLEKLAAAQEALVRVLDESRSGVEPPIPGVGLG